MHAASLQQEMEHKRQHCAHACIVVSHDVVTLCYVTLTMVESDLYVVLA